MNIILARHGNTFEAGQKAVWVGSRNDLPLVTAGVAQAERLGQGLLEAGVDLSAVYTGPLQRMTRYAEIALATLKVKVVSCVDMRLNEIDYGKWSGLTTEEVCEQFGKDAYDAWEKQAIWPKNSDWQESAEQLASRITSFANELTAKYTGNDTILVVASNGCLRYFLELIPGGLQGYLEEHSAKMGTGRISKLSYQQGAWKLISWDQLP